MVINDDLRDLIMQNATTDELRTRATKYGMITLRNYGMNFVFQGITTADEVLRETIQE